MAYPKNFIGLFNFGTGRSTVNRVAKMTKISKEKLTAKPSHTGLGWEIWKK
jgi:hypothetical protein